MAAPGPLDQAVRQASVLEQSDHRPWPLPQRQWLMGQTWDDLLFAHWRVPAERLQDLVPGLEVDTFDGSGWLGITPFVLSGLRLAGTLPVPGVSRFPELNVRTYVSVDGKPGIYFFSLDTASRLAVTAARRFYHLPYFRAQMAVRRGGDGWIRYDSTRADGRGPAAELRCRYRSAGAVRHAETGSVEHFLAERYCLYTVGPDGGVFRGEIHHPPWPLQDARAAFDVNTMPPAGLDLPAAEPLLHFAGRQDVVIWSLERV